MKFIIFTLLLIIFFLLAWIFFGIGYTKVYAQDNDLLLDCHGRFNYELGYIQIGNPSDIASFRLISDNGNELDTDELVKVVTAYNHTMGINPSAGINREVNGAYHLDDSRPTQNAEINIWFDDKGKVKTIGIFPDGGMRLRIRGVELDFPKDILLKDLFPKLHIGNDKVARVYIWPWER